MEFDELFEYIGGFGAFQVWTSVLLGMVTFLGTELINLNYVGYNMEHWCRVDARLSELPFSVQKHVAIPFLDTDNSTYSPCLMFDLNYSSYDAGDFLYWDRAAHSNAPTKPCNQWVYSQDVFRNSDVSRWDLVCDASWQVDLASSISIVGMLGGALATGALSEHLGRRLTFQVLLVVKLVNTLVYSLTPWWPLFLVGRFGNMVGSNGLYLLTFIQVVEVVGPQWRSLMSITLTLCFSFGFMVIPAVAYFIRDTTALQLVLEAPALLFVAYYWMVPESARWLVQRGRLQEAEEVVHHMAAVNGRRLPDHISLKDLEFSASQTSTASYLDLFTHRELRRRTIILSINWMTDSLLYYALSLNAGSLSGDVFLNMFLLGAVEVPAILLAMFLVNRRPFGRKYTNFICIFCAGVACFACIPLLVTNSLPWLVTTLSLVGKAGAAAGFAVIYLYSNELYPTEVRSMGLCVCSVTARFSGVLAPYVGGPLGSVWSPLPSLLYGVMGTLAGVLTLLLPDTLHCPLPDTIAQVEGPPSSRDLETQLLIQAEDSMEQARSYQSFDDKPPISGSCSPEMAPMPSASSPSVRPGKDA